MSDWFDDGLVDDVRPKLFECREKGLRAALATIVAADGGPRPVGSQMIVVGNRFWGFLSGGCIEDDVALNARAVIETGDPRHLIYGHGSPYIDMRLPCGGRIDVLVERIEPTDPAIGELHRLTEARLPARWRSDGVHRSCRSDFDRTVEEDSSIADVRYDPVWRLLVIGNDPFAIAAAALGRMTGFDTRLLAPFASDRPPPFGLSVDRRGLAAAIEHPAPDAWTAAIVATHDTDLDEEALNQLLRSKAGYIGVMGARRRIDDRTHRLVAAGFTDSDIARVHMPLGLPIRARSPWEVAVSALAEVIAHRRAGP